MAIYLSRKKGSGSATPITPSDSSPAILTANNAVNPTANGYAIASYTEVVPSNASPATLSNGSIYKIKTNGGKAVASVTDVTPSNTPTSVATNDVVKLGDSGVIIKFVPSVQGNKSVTATTSQQIVTPDQGYDALEQVTVNPQVHSAIYVPLQNEPYNDMGAQNNYRYVDTSGMVIPHPISPSNSNPVSVAPSYPIEYTANGYAIESYSSITPSNSSPATITSGNIYTATANGKAVSSVTDITPSNSSPVSLSSGSIYKPSASGYAISSYSSKTPSDSSPASVSSGAIIKNAGSSTGYLYASSGLLKGNITLIASGYITDSNNYYTYTFSQAITTCLVVSFGDSGYSPMTYTGTGTATNISTSTGNPYFNSMKIKNVKSGDTVKIGKITISGNNRKMYAIFSIT